MAKLSIGFAHWRLPANEWHRGYWYDKLTKTLPATFLATLLLMAATSLLYAQTLIGVYKTDFNELTLYHNGNEVTGTYKHQNGKVEGTLNGNTLSGWWYQTNGKGKFVFTFTPDFSSFTGKWGYNDAAPNSSVWNGKRTLG